MKTKSRMLAFSLYTLSTTIFADPVECDLFFDWENAISRQWRHEENWGPDNNRVPDEDDVVCLIDGPEVLPDDNKIVILQTLSSYQAKAKAIWIDPTVVLEIYGDEVLTLYGGDSETVNSYIDGRFEICPPFDLQQEQAGKIVLAKSLSILSTGSGERTIHMIHATSAIEAAPGSGAVLTLGTGLTIKGTGHLKLPVVNNGTIRPFAFGNLSGEITLFDSLTLNGVLLIEATGTAFLTNNLTVPNGGVIELQSSGSDIGKLKPRSSYTPTVTVASGGILKGAGESHLKLINNGLVTARGGTLEIKAGGDGSSTGIWTAETSTGHLHVTSEILGSAKWKLTDNAAAKIEIDHACNCLDGLVEISLGTLDVDANFHTQGDLSIGGKDSLIDVAGGTHAKFDIMHGCIIE